MINSKLSFREEWLSPNGKYLVLVRKFRDDPQILVSHWVFNNNKRKGILYRNLPKYVVEKIEELKAEASFRR